ncbi:MAG: glycosyltransferase [bacterium]
MQENKTRKVLILTADAGFGHRSAANAIKAALEQRYGTSITAEISNPLDDKRTPFFLRDSQSDYDKIVRNLPELYRVGYERSDARLLIPVLENALTVLLFDVMRDILKQFQPDAVITTYPLYQAPFVAVRTLHRYQVPIYTVVTDLVSVHRIWFHPQIDRYFVPTEDVAELAQNNRVSPGRIEISGIPVSPLFSTLSADKEALRNELGWQQGKTTFLAVGSRRVEQLEATLNALNHSGHDIQLVCVAGKDRALYKQLMATDWHKPAYIYEFVSDMPKLMLASDCLISKAGGLIVSESLAAGLPILLIDIIPGQETGNAEYVVHHGAGEIALDTVTIFETVFHWLNEDGKILRECTQKARNLGKPGAAFTIAEKTWEGQKATPNIDLGLAKELRENLIRLLERYHVDIPAESPLKKK